MGLGRMESADVVFRTKLKPVLVTFSALILLAYCKPQTEDELVKRVFPYLNQLTEQANERMPGYGCLPHNLCPNNKIDLRETEGKCDTNKRCCPLPNTQNEPEQETEEALGLKFSKCSPGHVCVPYYSCPNKTIIKTGSLLIPSRDGYVLNYDDECPNQLERCCFIDKAKNDNPNKSPVNGCEPGYNCVRHFLCKNGTNTIIRDGSLIIDLRENDRKNPCPHYLDTCCLPANTGNQPGSMIAGIGANYEFDLKKKLSITSDGCGFRNENGVVFRISGAEHNETEYAEFPWMIAVLERKSNQNRALDKYKCGGSLIHPSVVLTVGHCVAQAQPSKLIARAGEWDTQTPNEGIPHQDREVFEIITHERLNIQTAVNDIALLFLANEFNLAPNAKPVCLPPPNFNFDRSTCYVTGWGKDEFGKFGKYQVILKKIDLLVVPRDTCQSQLRATRLGIYYELDESFICAGGEKGKDACTGDGGSPLVCPIPGTENRYYQAGVVAWGIGCGEENVPGVYANVANLRPWIDEQLAKREIDYSFFTP